MIKERKEKQIKKEQVPNVKTPTPPQEMDPSIPPSQENSGQEKQQRPDRLGSNPAKKNKNEKPKLLGDPIEIDDETTI